MAGTQLSPHADRMASRNEPKVIMVQVVVVALILFLVCGIICLVIYTIIIFLGWLEAVMFGSHGSTRW